MAKATKKTKPSSTLQPEAFNPTELPEQEYISSQLQQVALFSEDKRFTHIKGFFQRLANNPPQVVLLEGGTITERLEAAHFWALLLNCPSAFSTGTPCFSCAICSRMIVHMHRDFFFLDGNSGNIKIEDVRTIKNYLGEPPREAKERIILIREAQALAPPAANALLKSLEEPQPATSFLLTTPQRERLLPTLVSRSMVLTLPWPKVVDATDEMIMWAVALCKFIATGKEWFSITGAKGTITTSSVELVISLLRRAMVVTLGADLHTIPHEKTSLDDTKQETLEIIGTLAKELSKIPTERLRFLDEVLAEAQESLAIGANPSVILDWLATRVYLLCPR